MELRNFASDRSGHPTNDVTVTITSGDTILVVVPPSTNLTGLIPVVKITGKTISPASGVAQDFSSPVIYTVTAEDGSQVVYTVIVSSRSAVYFGSSDNNFYAVDAVRGTLIWKDSAMGSFAYASPAMANGVIYAGCIDHKMYAMDAATGVVKWTYSTNSSIESSPAVVGGTVYFGSDDHNFYAVDASTGSPEMELYRRV